MTSSRSCAESGTTDIAPLKSESGLASPLHRYLDSSAACLCGARARPKAAMSDAGEGDDEADEEIEERRESHGRAESAATSGELDEEGRRRSSVFSSSSRAVQRRVNAACSVRIAHRPYCGSRLGVANYKKEAMHFHCKTPMKNKKKKP